MEEPFHQHGTCKCIIIPFKIIQLLIFLKRSSVRLGEYDTKSDNDCVEQDCADPVVNVRIAEKIPHESYDPASKNQANDIALLRLERTVTFTDFIKPICLPRSQNLRSADLTGIALSVSGWGKTENGIIFFTFI